MTATLSGKGDPGSHVNHGAVEHHCTQFCPGAELGWGQTKVGFRHYAPAANRRGFLCGSKALEFEVLPHWGSTHPTPNGGCIHRRMHQETARHVFRIRKTWRGNLTKPDIPKWELRLLSGNRTSKQPLPRHSLSPFTTSS